MVAAIHGDEDFAHHVSATADAAAFFCRHRLQARGEPSCQTSMSRKLSRSGWHAPGRKGDNTEVLIGHCPDYSALCNTPIMTADPAMVTRLIQQEEEEVNRIVSKIKDKLSQHGVRGKLLRLNGDAGHAIVKAAESEGATCIVTGTRGQGKVRRTLLGSVSDYILHHAHVPVLVCRHKGQDDPGTRDKKDE